MAKPPGRFPAFPKGYGRHPAARFQSRRRQPGVPLINARRSRAHGRALVVQSTHQRPAKPGARTDRSGRCQIGLAPPHGHGRSPARRREATAHEVRSISSPVRAGGYAGTPPHEDRAISSPVRGRWAAGGAAGRQNNCGSPAARRTPIHLPLADWDGGGQGEGCVRSGAACCAIAKSRQEPRPTPTNTI